MKKRISDTEAHNISNKMTIKFMSEGLNNCQAYEKSCDYVMENYIVYCDKIYKAWDTEF